LLLGFISSVNLTTGALKPVGVTLSSLLPLTFPWKFVIVASTFEILPVSIGALRGYPPVKMLGVITTFVFTSLPFGSVTVIFNTSPTLTVPSFGTVIRTFDVFKSLSFACSTLVRMPSSGSSLTNLTVGAPGIIVSSPLFPLL